MNLHRGDFKSPSKVIKKLIEIKNSDNLITGSERVRFYVANILDSWKQFRKSNLRLRLCLACIDLN